MGQGGKMAVIRTSHNRENPYVMLNKHIFNGSGLSLKARGLWGTCMSKPDNWNFHVSALIKELKEGRTAIYSALNELMEAGYCIRGQRKCIKGARFQAVEYLIYEYPYSEEEKEAADEYFKSSVLPPENTQSGFQHTEKAPLINIYSNQVKTKHMPKCPNALSSKDELIVEGTPLRGKAKEAYESFTSDELQAFQALRSFDSVFNIIAAINLAKSKGSSKINKALEVFKQRVTRGDVIKNKSKYLHKILMDETEPLPEHAEQNRKEWDKIKHSLPISAFKEKWDYVQFVNRPDYDISFRVSPEFFMQKLEKIQTLLKTPKEKLEEYREKNIHENKEWAKKHLQGKKIKSNSRKITLRDTRVEIVTPFGVYSIGYLQEEFKKIIQQHINQIQRENESF